MLPLAAPAPEALGAAFELHTRRQLLAELEADAAEHRVVEAGKDVGQVRGGSAALGVQGGCCDEALRGLVRGWLDIFY